MGIFDKIFGKKEKELSLYGLIAKEIRLKVTSVFLKRGIATEKEMNKVNYGVGWFEVRPHRYGESGSHYGTAEIIEEPGSNFWPQWQNLIPTSEIKDVQSDIYHLKSDCPFGGHMMEEENRHRFACESAIKLIDSVLRIELMEREKR